MLVNSKRDPSIEDCHFESFHTIFFLSMIQFLNNKGYGYEALFFFYNYWILDYNKKKRSTDLQESLLQMLHVFFVLVNFTQAKSWHRDQDNSLGPSDTIWRWRSWSTLVQVMACCLTAPSHYLNQCWLITREVLWHSSEDIIIRRFEDTNH